MGKQPPDKNSVPAAPPVHLLEQFMDNQAKELSLRAQELQNLQLQEKNSFEFSREALRVQAQDRKEHRDFLLTQRKYSFYFLAFILALIIGMIVYALFKGDKDFALEVVKAIIFLCTGGLGGYGYARSKTTTKEASKKSSGK